MEEAHMPAFLGTGDYRYRVVENFAKLPDGWQLTDVASVAVDSKDRVYVFNRGAHPMVVLDREGNFLRSWGEGLFSRAHGLHIDADDNLYCTDDGDHTVRKCTTDGKVLLTIGIPQKPAPFMSGEPFHRCTHTALSPKGEIYVSDGYGNARVHKFTPRRQADEELGRARHRSRPVQHRAQYCHRCGRLGLCRRPREPSRAGLQRRGQIRDAME
jgi:DNA-binding beta-propeller fold protein YncE